MKPQTKSLAKVVKQALLQFSPEDLLEIIEYWIQKFGESLSCFDDEDEIRLVLGYKIQERNGKISDNWDELNTAYRGEYDGCSEFVSPSPENLYAQIEAMEIEDFYHQIIWLAGQSVRGCGIPPNTYSDGYEFMSNLAFILFKMASISPQPAKIAKVVFNYD
jgi:hypothetical protein